jgi:hypothetical protein
MDSSFRWNDKLSGVILKQAGIQKKFDEFSEKCWDGSFSILIWVTLFGTPKNPPFPPFQGGIDKFPPFKRGIKGDLKTSIIEFVTLIVNHAKMLINYC